jgi:hypothetical protein
MNRTTSREIYCREVAGKLITSLHSKRYRPSGMLIHWQILMRLAASGAAVTVKHRAVNRSTKLKPSL